MKILLIGDVIGKPGIGALRRHLAALRDRHEISFVTANAENSALGFGVTPESAQELFAAGVDCLTSGNHVWDKKEVLPYLEEERRLLRPANYPSPCPGSGWYIGTTDEGVRVGVLNLMGRVHMAELDCPFRAADRILKEIRPRTDVVVVDMHAEITSEKGAMGWYLDGRVSAVYGTHTHVPTADERILPSGTAFLTDLGMTGPYDSIIGVEQQAVLQRFLTQRRSRMQTATGNVQIRAAVLEVDPSNGRALSLERITVMDGRA
jgi:metallophosphoesterase (TIGR00282 family)